MRIILLALLSFVLVAPQAGAAVRDDQRSGSRSSASQGGSQAAKGAKQEPRRAVAAPAATAARPAATVARPAATATRNAAPAARNAVAARPVTRQMAQAGTVRTQRTGIVVRGASAATVSRDSAACTRRNGRTVCGPARRDGVPGWQAGLPVADFAQRECPAGTFATLARGHENVVRCMPI